MWKNKMTNCNIVYPAKNEKCSSKLKFYELNVLVNYILNVIVSSFAETKKIKDMKNRRTFVGETFISKPDEIQDRDKHLPRTRSLTEKLLQDQVLIDFWMDQYLLFTISILYNKELKLTEYQPTEGEENVGKNVFPIKIGGWYQKTNSHLRKCDFHIRRCVQNEKFRFSCKNKLLNVIWLSLTRREGKYKKLSSSRIVVESCQKRINQSNQQQ